MTKDDERMTDPDADALYRAIVRHPEDDTPRLVYADWLQENGRAEEGEFLRVQCRLAVGEPDDPEYPALVDHEEELRLWLGTHVPGPRPTFPAGLSVEGGSHWWWNTYRGFPRFLEFDGYEKVGVKPMRALAASLARAFDTLPTRWLVVRDITVGQLAALLKQPVLARLAHLTAILPTNGSEADEVARLLANSRHLRNLRGLVLGAPVGDAGCAALAGAPWGELEWFAPTCHEIPPTGLRALAGAAWFRNLRALRLADSLPDETFESLGQLAFPHLHTLDLSENAFPEDDWEAFARSLAFPALARLVLAGGDMSGGRVEALATAAGFELRVLDLSGTGCRLGDGLALAAAPWARSLRVLDLATNALDAAEVKAVAGCKKFRALRHLNLRDNALGPTGLSALVANPALRDLRALNLSLSDPAYDTAGLTPTHFERFLAKLDTPDLRHLDLSGRPVGAKAARRLADARFSSLTRLGLGGCKLTDAALAALVASPALGDLIQLDLGDNRLSAAPEALANRSVFPRLASCSLANNPLPAAVVRKLRRRPGVRV